MRKPLLALGLVMTTGLGVMPLADALAASPASTPLNTSPGNSSPPVRPATSQTTAAPTGNSTAALNGKTTSTVPATNRGTTTSANRGTVTTGNGQGAGVSGAAIVQTAMQYIGYPYSALGASPSTGFSCIGFVSYVYHQNGINLPGDLGGAMAFAPSVPFSSLLPGDVLFFSNTVWPGLSHAAIYIGGGKFIHSEYFGVGVRITSFNGDPKDGDYWIAHYTGANRPWTGAAVGAVVAANPGASQAAGTAVSPNAPTATAVKTIRSGPTATVSVPSLNVRAKPSMNAGVQQVINSGTSVVIIGKHKNWYKVQLPDGTIGWVVGVGIGAGSSTAPSTGAAGSTSVDVGTPTAPTQIQKVRTARRVQGPTATIQVDSLRVHSAPGTSAPVVNSLSQGQKVKVLARSNGWVKVQLPDGSVGWISSQYASVNGSSQTRPTQPTQPSTAVQRAPVRRATATKRSGPSQTATVAMNVRSSPSLTSGVMTVVQPGSKYQIVGWSHGWAQVRLPDGTTGWVSGTVLGVSGSAATPSYSSYSYGSSKTRAKTSAAKRSNATAAYAGWKLTAGVRVHSRPGVNAPVVGLAAAGTRVQVLSYSGSWVQVRLPSGQTGYVLGTFVGK